MKRHNQINDEIKLTDNDVVITGMGVVNSIGNNIQEFCDALKSGKSGIEQIDKQGSSSLKLGGYIKNFNFNNLLEQRYGEECYKNIKKHALKIGKRSSIAVQCGLISSLEAWEQAKLWDKSINPERIGIILCGNNISNNTSFRTYYEVLDDLEYVSPSYAQYFMDTDQMAAVSELLNIKGEGYTTGGASASGNVGIINGCRLIHQGIVDVCLVIGPVADISDLELNAFINIGALGGKKYSNNPNKVCRPFDLEHNGFVYGQGTGCLVLESLNSAQNRGVTYFANVLGGAVALDANRGTNPSRDGEVRVMTQALQIAGVGKNQVDYINAHGSSSPLGDEVEVKAIKDVFYEHLNHIKINSTKGLTGHCLFSAGVIEAIATILQMNHGFLHPNLNLKHPIDSDVNFVGDKYEISDIRYSVSNSFGFGGINSSIVLCKGEL